MSREPNERFEGHGEGGGVFRDDSEVVGHGYEVPRERLGRPQSRWKFSEKDQEGHGIPIN